jgi:hypothetical protein
VSFAARRCLGLDWSRSTAPRGKVYLLLLGWARAGLNLGVPEVKIRDGITGGREGKEGECRK